jgi:hypothetical protein
VGKYGCWLPKNSLHIEVRCPKIPYWIIVCATFTDRWLFKTKILRKTGVTTGKWMGGGHGNWDVEKVV